MRIILPPDIADMYFGEDWYESKIAYEKELYGDEESLYEGLIVTHPVLKSLDILDKRGFSVSEGLGYSFYVLIEPNTDLDDLETITNNLGYFPATVGPTKRNMNKYDVDGLQSALTKFKHAFIRYEAKYDTPTNILGLQFVYHATNKLFMPSIEKKGLVCKAKSKMANHPERIYLAFAKEGAVKFANHIVNSVRPARLRRNGEFEKVPPSVQELYSTAVILQISVNALPHTFKVYNDPNYSDKGCYTLNTIPWRAITVIDEFKVNN